MQPLTHHEIIGRAEPFTRSGRRVDLAASQRLERRLAFKPVQRGDVTEALELSHPYERTYVLARTLRAANGLECQLHAEGPEPAVLLQLVDAVPPERQLNSGTGFDAALSFRVPPGTTSAVAQALPPLILTEAMVRIGSAGAGAYTLAMRVPRTRGVSLEFELTAPDEAAFDPPEDLLSVIGWDWSPLEKKKGYFAAKLRVRGGEPRRSAGAEAKLERTARHLARTLGEPPEAYHERHRWARLATVLRRGIPSLTVLGMFGGVALLPRGDYMELSPLRMMVFNAPILLMAIAFSLQEMPRFEIPPWPRRLAPTAWPVPAGAVASSGHTRA